MKKTLALVAALGILAFPALAGLSPQYAAWGDGPARHLMTKDDLAKWKAIDADSAAQAFIDLFWARRDPTPGTPDNEARIAFEQRVAAADANFTTSRTRGALSDRGRVLILLGAPSQVGQKAAGMKAEGMAVAQPGSGGNDVSVPSALPSAGRLVWTYGGERKPSFARGKALEVTFTDTEGRGDFYLATSERNNPEFVLGQAVERFIVNPDLTELPRVASTEIAPATSFRDSVLEAAYKEFRAAGNPAVGPASLTWGEFVEPTGEDVVALQLYVPAAAGIAAGRQLTLVGVVENEKGEILQVHEDPVTLADSRGDAFVDRALRLEPGKYTASFGLAENGKLVSMVRQPISVEGIDPAAPGASPLLLSNNVFPLQGDWSEKDPFIFGGLKVVPKGDAAFTNAGDLWYFTELRKPGLGDTGAPRMQVKIEIEGKTTEGKRVEMKFPMSPADAAKLHGTEDRYAIGLAIPLEGFKPGTYSMKVRVVDTVLTKTYDFEKTFSVAAAKSSS